MGRNGSRTASLSAPDRGITLTIGILSFSLDTAGSTTLIGLITGLSDVDLTTMASGTSTVATNSMVTADSTAIVGSAVKVDSEVESRSMVEVAFGEASRSTVGADLQGAVSTVAATVVVAATAGTPAATDKTKRTMN